MQRLTMIIITVSEKTALLKSFCHAGQSPSQQAGQPISNYYRLTRFMSVEKEIQHKKSCMSLQCADEFSGVC